jgi:hypothetical protein
MEGKKKHITSASPVKAESSSCSFPESDMRVGILYNRDGGVWLLHDQPMPDALKCVEYDAISETVTLITGSGRIADSGLKIPAEKSFYLERAMEVTAVLMKDGFVTDFAIVPMVVSNMTVN